MDVLKVPNSKPFDVVGCATNTTNGLGEQSTAPCEERWHTESGPYTFDSYVSCECRDESIAAPDGHSAWWLIGDDMDTDQIAEDSKIGDVIANILLLSSTLWPFLFLSACHETDPCGQLKRGECTAVHADIPITIDEPPPFDYDMSSRTMEELKTVSRANPCLLDGLDDISFSDVSMLAYYTDGHIVIDPAEKLPPDVDDAYDHAFQMFYRLHHEIGHHVFHHVLEEMCPSLLDHFQEFSWEDFDTIEEGIDPDGQGSAFLNDEAAENVDEDFAVTFCYYIFLPGEFQRRIEEYGAHHVPLVQKYDFMKDLFLGQEFSRPWDGMTVIPHPAD